jgi:hypothetical protein
LKDKDNNLEIIDRYVANAHTETVPREREKKKKTLQIFISIDVCMINRMLYRGKT